MKSVEWAKWLVEMLLPKEPLTGTMPLSVTARDSGDAGVSDEGGEGVAEDHDAAVARLLEMSCKQVEQTHPLAKIAGIGGPAAAHSQATPL